MPRSASSGRAATKIVMVVRLRPGRLLGIIQLGLGVLLTMRPEQVAASVAGPGGQPAPRWLILVLGVRSLLQGVVLTATPTPTVLVVGALVDATHAASMTPVIADSPRYRRAATISALTAAMSAGTGALAARQGQRTAEPPA